MLKLGGASSCLANLIRHYDWKLKNIMHVIGQGVALSARQLQKVAGGSRAPEGVIAPHRGADSSRSCDVSGAVLIQEWLLPVLGVS